MVKQNRVCISYAPRKQGHPQRIDCYVGRKHPPAYGPAVIITMSTNTHPRERVRVHRLHVARIDVVPIGRYHDREADDIEIIVQFALIFIHIWPPTLRVPLDRRLGIQLLLVGHNQRQITSKAG